MGGFKEGVGRSFQKCRLCYCTFEGVQDKFSEDDFSMRSNEQYLNQCTEIENAPVLETQKELQTTYGINKRSPLLQLPSFDVTKQLPQDVMHILLEGIIQYELNLVLNVFYAAGSFSLDQLNASIANHDYSFHEVSSKPPPLRKAVFNGDEFYKIKYNAAQTKTFLKLFPFIMHPFIDEDDDYYLFIVELIEIVLLVFAPVITSSGIDELQTKIENHLRWFKVLFPEKNLLPKHHYMVHFPSTIRSLDL